MEAEAEAVRCADAEGLTLVRSSNQAGYRGISLGRGGFTARASSGLDGRDYYIGSYKTAVEAALAYARYIGPVESARQAAAPLQRRCAPRQRGRSFGEPRFRADQQSDGMAVQCEAFSDNEDNSHSSIVPAVVIDGDHASGSTAQSATAPTPRVELLKRKRATQSVRVEYEFVSSTETPTLTIPVPRSIRGRLATVMVEFVVDEGLHASDRVN